MRKYQLVMVLTPDLKKDKKDKFLEDVKKLIGEVKEEKLDSLGEKKLAYPIRRERRGEFVVLNFEAETIAADFNKRVGIREELLRYLLVKN